MAVWVVDDQPRPISRYDICATYGEVVGILAHALLCDDNGAKFVTKTTTDVRCVHMGPPLCEQVQGIHVFGSIGLTASESLRIKAFVDERLLERRAHKKRLQALGERLASEEEYVISPAWLPPSPSQSLWRFSCAGFVIQAYLEADIDLVDKAVPLVGVDRLMEAYPWAQMQLMDRTRRGKLLIGEGESWPVIFVGYVIHSMNRTPEEVRAHPYVATQADIRYPVENSGVGRGSPGMVSSGQQ